MAYKTQNCKKHQQRFSHRAKRCTVASLRVRCAATNKVKYSYNQALLEARNMRRELDTTHHEYKCEHCHLFHVGSNSKKAK
ncbi:MAG: hypothetical protein WCG15_07115 [Actinomycetes bacterium]